MFSSWDLVRPHFWYPMSSLEQSMMELEQMSDMMVRPRFPFGVHREVLATPKYVERENPDDDDFFVDLPVFTRKYMYKPKTFQSHNIENEASSNRNIDNVSSDSDSTTDMDVDEGNEKVDQTDDRSNIPKAVNDDQDKSSTKSKCNNKSKKPKKQSHTHSYKVTPSTERTVTPKTNTTYSSYSFSNSSVLDDKGRRVTTTRRRYEDSTGRLKAVHEREIDGKKMRTTWSRQNKENEGQHESICSNGSPEEFETLWQQTPFGEAQKKSVKGQLQSESDVGNDVASVTTALKDTTMEEVPSNKAEEEADGEASAKDDDGAEEEN
ncbi:hypothetical protein PHPALM_9192 [Phytophthora palmivora]|uniref:Uncharacterized protein n=1 Tax=Phytophthora palmivora TaxID=4796 RepID=A0A2P4Y8A5_9STRA|nr:hypothetical protein PHPALM_9192 [Phytophthora palmivora]